MPGFELVACAGVYLGARSLRVRWNRQGTRIEVAGVALTVLGVLVLKGWV
ncbi:hypothetical protein [Hyphomicrobium sp.]|nr:hypothetical protein [Hyphomicrobium sp.]MCC7254262.1 hypothetical protein [Hyphomicrobium sp.]